MAITGVATSRRRCLGAPGVVRRGLAFGADAVFATGGGGGGRSTRRRPRAGSGTGFIAAAGGRGKGDGGATGDGTSGVGSAVVNGADGGTGASEGTGADGGDGASTTLSGPPPPASPPGTPNCSDNSKACSSTEMAMPPTRRRLLRAWPAWRVLAVAGCMAWFRKYCQACILALTRPYGDHDALPGVRILDVPGMPPTSAARLVRACHHGVPSSVCLQLGHSSSGLQSCSSAT